MLHLQSSGISLTLRLGTHSSIILSHLPLAWRDQYEKARANKARAAPATKAAECTPKKGAHKESSGKGAPKKDHAVRTDGPLTTHNTSEFRRFLKDGNPMDKPTKYFNSTRKPCKKTGSGDSSQMACLTEKLTKLEKKLYKSKKHSKKRACDSSDSDLDSDHERVYGSTGKWDPADKRLK